MNKNNKITLTGATGIPILTYSIYYWDYRPFQPVRTLLYVGKAYNFNNASSVDIYLNDIIKNVPNASGYYDIKTLPTGVGWHGLNLVTNLEVSVVETNTTHTFTIYQDNTKSYIVGQDFDNLEPGEVVSIPTTFNTLNILHNNTARQLDLVIVGNFDDEDAQFALKYVYTNRPPAQHIIGATNLINAPSHRLAVKFTVSEDYIYNNAPPGSKNTLKAVLLQYCPTKIPAKIHEFTLIQFTNDPCEHNVLSFENRNGSISYLQLKGNTIYSESIQHHKKIDMFDNETVYASLVDETITVNTGWLTDEEAKALEDLYVSKKIFLFDTTLGKYLAVNVDENSYTKREFKNERKLKNYTIKLKLQQKEVL